MKKMPAVNIFGGGGGGGGVWGGRRPRGGGWAGGGEGGRLPGWGPAPPPRGGGVRGLNCKWVFEPPPPPPDFAISLCASPETQPGSIRGIKREKSKGRIKSEE
jgi:hypothetical protein